MSFAYVVGHIRVKDTGKWDRYRAQVPATLQPWGAELVFRGARTATFAGEHDYDDVVVIRFPDREAAAGWHASPAYQALVPLRREAADVVLLAYDA